MSRSAPERVFVPREHVNDDSVIVLKIHCADGSAVEPGQVILDIETSKTTVEVTSPGAGILRLAVQEDDEVEIGALLFEVHGDMAVTALADTGSGPASPAPVAETPESVPGSALFSEPARLRMEALGLDPGSFAGRRWVTVADVEAAHRARADAPGVNPATRDAGALVGLTLLHRAERKEPAAEPAQQIPHTERRRSKRKRAEVNSLTYYGNPLPQSTIGIEVTLPGRRIVPPPPLFRDGISDLVVYETGKLLPQFPELNAFHIDQKRFGTYDVVNFGISYDSGRNLKVLTLERSNELALRELQSRMELLLDSYEDGRPLEPELVEGSTITLSDLSRSNAHYMLPLLNGRQSLILGLTRRAADIFVIHASFDHRIAEGLLVTQFLEELRARVESYFRDESGIVDVRCHSCSKPISEDVALGSRGFLNVRLPTGEDALLCRNCFEGL